MTIDQGFPFRKLNMEINNKGGKPRVLIQKNMQVFFQCLERNLGIPQTSKMECFTTMVGVIHSLSVVAKLSI